MANGLVGRVWEHPWQIIRRMWQMGIKTFLNSNWQPSCYLRSFFFAAGRATPLCLENGSSSNAPSISYCQSLSMCTLFQ